MKKNEEFIGIVEGVGMNGEGVIKNGETVVFVPFTILGEKIKYKILKVSNKIAYGKLLEVFTPAEERVRVKCPVFSKCGGCDLQHIKYNEQLKIKENKVKNCFKKIAFLPVEVMPTIKSDFEYRYRNKLQLPVGEVNGETVIGFYACNSHRIIPISDCYINPEWTADIIYVFKKYMDNFSLKGYNEYLGSGDIREITVKEIFGSLIITIVSLKEKLPNTDYIVNELKEKLKMKFSLFINLNTEKTNVIYGEEFIKVYGEDEYSAEMLGIKYKSGVQSFMQVNSFVCEKLYSNVVSCIKPDDKTTVIDAYSGAGLMTALLAKKAGKAIGIEIIKEATIIADELAKENNLSDKMVNINGKCEDILNDVIEKEREKGNKLALVIDPPRKGVELPVIDAIIKSGIEHIVYVSCKPSTLARDIGLIVGTLENINGEIKRAVNPQKRYRIEMIKPFDMFPQTKHVETIVELVLN